jgi:hypothetical protein
MWHANFHSVTAAGDLFRIDPIWGKKKCTPAAAKVCGKCTSGDVSARAFYSSWFSNYAAFHYAQREREWRAGEERTLWSAFEVSNWYAPPVVLLRAEISQRSVGLFEPQLGASRRQIGI